MALRGGIIIAGSGGATARALPCRYARSQRRGGGRPPPGGGRAGERGRCIPGAFFLPCSRGRPGGGVPESGTRPCSGGCEPPPNLPRVQGRNQAPCEIG